jgi:hypothetical protein
MVRLPAATIHESSLNITGRIPAVKEALDLVLGLFYERIGKSGLPAGEQMAVLQDLETLLNPIMHKED